MNIDCRQCDNQEKQSHNETGLIDMNNLALFVVTSRSRAFQQKCILSAIPGVTMEVI